LSGDGLADKGTHDSHHSSTSLVDFHIELVLKFISLQEVGDERTSVSSSVVSGVVGSGPDGQLTDSTEEEDLGDSGNGDREKSVHAIRDVRETDSHLLGKVSGELNSSVVEKHTDNGSHGDTSMLTFDSTTALEVGMESGEFSSGVLGRVQPSKRIVQTQRSSDTDGGVKGVDTFTEGRRASL
jgi:hypothetical protein